MSIYSVVAIVLTALLFAFSAAQLGLSAYVVHYAISRTGKTFEWTTQINGPYQLHWTPLHNLTRSYALQLATGAVGITIGAAVLALLILNRSLTFVGTGKRAPRTVTWPLTTIVLSFLMFALALSSLVVSFYDNTHYGASSINSAGLCLTAYLTTSSCYSSGLSSPYTIEGWTCRMAPLYRRMYNSQTSSAETVLPQTCHVAYISRWWTIAPMIIPLLLIVVALFEIRRKNIKRFNERQQMGAGLYPKEQSFSSAATEAPLAPAAAGVPSSHNGSLPQYTAAPELGSDREKYETAGKQVMEAPEKSLYGGGQHQVYSEMSAAGSNVRVATDRKVAPSDGVVSPM